MILLCEQMMLGICIRLLLRVGPRRRILENKILWQIQRIRLLILIFHRIKTRLVSLVFQKILILQMVDLLENRDESGVNHKTRMIIEEWIQTHQLETDRILLRIHIRVDFIQQTLSLIKTPVLILEDSWILF